MAHQYIAKEGRTGLWNPRPAIKIEGKAHGGFRVSLVGSGLSFSANFTQRELQNAILVNPNQLSPSAKGQTAL